MFRKLSIKTLSILFVALLATTIVVKTVDNSKGVNTLKTVLFDINTDEVTSVIIHPKMLNGKQIELQKDGDNWRVISDGKNNSADQSIVNGLINQLNGLKPLRLATRDKDQWKKFELTDSLSSMVTFQGSQGELARLYIGKFSYRQSKQAAMMQQNPYNQRPQGTMTTYVRSGDDKEVFAVEGFLASSVNRDVDAFRNKRMTQATKTGIQKISFEYPADSSFTMVKNENTWMIDGIALDSTSVDKYLSGISRLNGLSFTDNTPSSFSHKVKIQSGTQSIELNALLEDEEVTITSSQNPGTVFKESKSHNFDKLFVNKEQFIK